jgi:hypothetical protein
METRTVQQESETDEEAVKATLSDLFREPIQHDAPKRLVVLIPVTAEDDAPTPKKYKKKLYSPPAKRRLRDPNRKYKLATYRMDGEYFYFA